MGPVHRWLAIAGDARLLISSAVAVAVVSLAVLVLVPLPSAAADEDATIARDCALGELLVSRGELTLAAEVFQRDAIAEAACADAGRQRIDQRRASAATAIERGTALQDADQIEGARAEFELARRLDPENRAAVDLLRALSEEHPPAGSALHAMTEPWDELVEDALQPLAVLLGELVLALVALGLLLRLLAAWVTGRPAHALRRWHRGRRSGPRVVVAPGLLQHLPAAWVTPKRDQVLRRWLRGRGARARRPGGVVLGVLVRALVVAGVAAAVVAAVPGMAPAAASVSELPTSLLVSSILLVTVVGSVALLPRFWPEARAHLVSGPLAAACLATGLWLGARAPAEAGHLPWTWAATVTLTGLVGLVIATLVRPPRVEIGEIAAETTSDGTAYAARLRTALSELAGSRPGGLRIVEGIESSGVDESSLAALAPNKVLRALAATAHALAPREHYRVAGYLHGEDGDCELTIHRNGRLVAARSSAAWLAPVSPGGGQPPPASGSSPGSTPPSGSAAPTGSTRPSDGTPPSGSAASASGSAASAAGSAASAAGAWTLSVITRTHHGEARLAEHSAGTTDPLSIALQVSAEAALEAGRQEAANRQYAEAVAIDHGNLAARLGFAVTEVMLATRHSDAQDAADPVAAIRYEAAVQQLEELRDLSPSDSPMWCRASYSLAAALLNRSLTPTATVEDASEARDASVELVNNVAQPIEEAKREDRIRFAEEILSSALLLLAELLRMSPSTAEPQPKARLRAVRTPAGDLVPWTAVAEGQLEWLRLSTASPADLVAYAIAREQLTDRDRYNHACYLVSIGDFDRALYRLEESFRSSPVLAVWSARDPSLEDLRRDPSSRRRLEELRNTYAPGHRTNGSRQERRTETSARMPGAGRGWLGWFRSLISTRVSAEGRTPPVGPDA